MHQQQLRLLSRSPAASIAVGLACAAILLSGCASATRVPLAPQTSAKIGGTPAAVAVNHPEVTARIPGSNVAGTAITAASAVPGGFLVGALIGAAAGATDAAIENRQAKRAEELVTPIRDRLVGFDAPAEIADSLRGQLASIAWINAESVSLERNAALKKDVIKAWVETAPGKTLLLVSADYYFSADFGTLIVDATASVLTANSTMRSGAVKRGYAYPVLYHNYFSVQARLPNSIGGLTQNAAGWAARDDVTARLETCVQELAEMIAYDLQQPAINPNKSAAQTQVFLPVPGRMVKAMAEKAHEGRSWVRAASGELFSIE